jgi:integrase
MRFGEIMGLEWEDVDFTWRRITLRNTKNNETRYVPMNPLLKETLEEMHGGKGRVFSNPETGKPYNDIRKAMRRALRKAGVERHIRFHDLRHTTGSHLAMTGATEREIGEVLGHKDPKMSRRYSHLSPSHIQGVVDRLNFSKSGEIKNDTEKVSQ